MGVFIQAPRFVPCQHAAGCAAHHALGELPRLSAVRVHLLLAASLWARHVDLSAAAISGLAPHSGPVTGFSSFTCNLQSWYFSVHPSFLRMLASSVDFPWTINCSAIVFGDPNSSLSVLALGGGPHQWYLRDHTVTQGIFPA